MLPGYSMKPLALVMQNRYGTNLNSYKYDCYFFPEKSPLDLCFAFVGDFICGFVWFSLESFLKGVNRQLSVQKKRFFRDYLL